MDRIFLEPGPLEAHVTHACARCGQPAALPWSAPRSDVADSDRPIAQGAFAYVEKPFTVERLDAVMRAALAG